MNCAQPFQFWQSKGASFVVPIRERNIHVLYLLNLVLNDDTTLFVSQKLSPVKGQSLYTIEDFVLGKQIN